MSPFTDENCSKQPKIVKSTNKTDFYHIDYTWSLHILASNDYAPEKKRRYRWVFVVYNNFSKIECSDPLKKENANKLF